MPATTTPPSYNAAFDYDGHERVSELTARAALTAHHDDLLGAFMERLPAKLGRRAVMARMPKTQHARWISRFLAKAKGPDAPPPPEPEPISRRATRTSARAAGHQLLVRRWADGPGQPLVLLPAAPDTGSGLRDLTAQLGTSRPVYAVDLPGTGGSDALRKSQPSIDDFAESVLSATRSLGLRRFDLYGTGCGAVVALAMARSRPNAVTSLILDGLPLLDRGARREMRKHAEATVTPEHDGSHLVRVWTYVRDHELYSPRFDRTRHAIRHVTPASPDEIHRRTLEVMKAPETFWLPGRAALDFPLERSLKSTPEATLISTLADDVAAADARQVARLCGRKAVTFADASDRVAGIETFLGES